MYAKVARLWARVVFITLKCEIYIHTNVVFLLVLSRSPPLIAVFQSQLNCLIIEAAQPQHTYGMANNNKCYCMG